MNRYSSTKESITTHIAYLLFHLQDKIVMNFKEKFGKTIDMKFPQVQCLVGTFKRKY